MRGRRKARLSCAAAALGLLWSGLAASLANADNAEIVGTWRLVSMAKYSEAGERQPMGLGWDRAEGYIIYTAEGRMMVLIAAAGRKPMGYPNVTDQARALAHKTMTAYTGTYEFHGDHVVHHVDMASYPDWQGPARRRAAKLSGNRITLTTPLMERSGSTLAKYELVWERVE